MSGATAWPVLDLYAWGRTEVAIAGGVLYVAALPPEGS